MRTNTVGKMKKHNEDLYFRDLCNRLSSELMVKVTLDLTDYDEFEQKIVGGVCEGDCYLKSIDIDDKHVEVYPPDYTKPENEGIYETIDMCCSDGMIYVSDITPYLRPISSMTEQECNKLFEILGIKEDGSDFSEWIKINDIGIIRLFTEKGKDFEDIAEAIDYLNSIHIDYRGLIAEGAALEAKEGMYPDQKVRKQRYVAKRLMDEIIYDNDYVNRYNPLSAKHYGDWINKIAEVVCFPYDNLKFFTNDNIELLATGNYADVKGLIRAYPQLQPLHDMLNKYFYYLSDTFDK